MRKKELDSLYTRASSAVEKGSPAELAIYRLYAQACLLQERCAAQRAELRRLNKPAHWAHLAVRVYERVAQEIDASLKKMGIELPLKVKN